MTTSSLVEIAQSHGFAAWTYCGVCEVSIPVLRPDGVVVEEIAQVNSLRSLLITLGY